MILNHIYNESCETGLKQLPDQSVNCCVTSPPYYGLRDYGHPDQIGLEKTPELYVENLVNVFREVKRVLRDDGTLWLNLGDSYCSTAGGTMGDSLKQTGILSGVSDERSEASRKFRPKVPEGLKPKDLIGIPWMVAFALRADGWYLRQDIIWHKPNPMPESVTDRCTKSHEYIFLLSKSSRYYYDYSAIKTEITDATIQRLMQDTRWQNGSNRIPGKTNGNMKVVGELRKGYEHRGTGDKKLAKHSGNYAEDGSIIGGGLANKKSVWTVNTMPYSEAHFATFPPNLIVDCIKAGCPEFVCPKCGKPRERITEKEYVTHENWYGSKVLQTHNDRGKAGSSYNECINIKTTGFTDCECGVPFEPGIVLDPFMGSGTTAMVARKLNRNYVGFELNTNYIKIAEKRLYQELGMFQ